MFDISFLELLVIAVIALVVLGPERLPGFIRTVGLMIGRIKRGFADVRAQVEREIGADEIRQQLHNEKIMAALEKQDKKSQPKEEAEPTSNVSRSHESVTQPVQTAAEPSPAETPPGNLTDAPTEPAAEPQNTTHER